MTASARVDPGDKYYGRGEHIAHRESGLLQVPEVRLVAVLQDVALSVASLATHGHTDAHIEIIQHL